MISDKHLLFIEPQQRASDTPVIDAITRKMCAAFRQARRDLGGYGGIHECRCGALSTNQDYHVPGGELTHSLCIHYLAHHRSEVPDGQLARVDRLQCGQAEPNEQELIGPREILSGIRASVEKMLGPQRIDTWASWGLDVGALCEALRGTAGWANDLTPAQKDAHELYGLLTDIPHDLLPLVHQTAVRTHGSMHAWAAEALRICGWNRAAWVQPFYDLLQLSPEVFPDKRRVRAAMRLVILAKARPK